MLRYILFAVVAIATYFAENLFPFLIPKVQNVSLIVLDKCAGDRVSLWHLLSHRETKGT
jgi:hypothetical protein